MSTNRAREGTQSLQICVLPLEQEIGGSAPCSRRHWYIKLTSVEITNPAFTPALLSQARNKASERTSDFNDLPAVLCQMSMFLVELNICKSSLL